MGMVVHPRWRGEKFKKYFSDDAEWGSPPLMRGKGYNSLYLISFTRIIPMCMGKSQNRSILFEANQDHPHVYGEKSETVASV